MAKAEYETEAEALSTLLKDDLAASRLWLRCELIGWIAVVTLGLVALVVETLR